MLKQSHSQQKRNLSRTVESGCCARTPQPQPQTASREAHTEQEPIPFRGQVGHSVVKYHLLSSAQKPSADRLKMGCHSQILH